jgi:polyisoprenoid-binding protein YceI
MEKTKWLVDPAHSEVQFKAKHLMITTVTGYFKNFTLEVETEDGDFRKASKILFTADIDSIDTNNPQRDAHLKSADFFSADRFGKIKFVGKRLRKYDADFMLDGELTIRDVTKPIEVKVTYSGIVVDPFGQTKAGFTVDGAIKRKDFNLTWDAVTEAGQVVVSNEIKIHCEIQLIKQTEEGSEMKEEEEHEMEV